MRAGTLLKKSLLVLAVFSASVGVVSADVPALTVSGNQIYSGGEIAGLAGNSFNAINTGSGHEKMYNASVVKWLKDDWKSRIVRIVVDVDDSTPLVLDANKTFKRALAVFNEAVANDMYVIVDFHTHHAENKKNEAKQLFEYVAEYYSSYNNVIYEIYNEPLNVSWDNVIKPYAEDVISTIRSMDQNNLIIVGTPNLSQDVDIASLNPIMGENIAYALHFDAGTHGQSLRDKALTAMNNGIPLIVTEWSCVNQNGGGEVNQASCNEWMAFLKEHNLTHLNMAVSNKNEGTSIIKPGVSPNGNWTASDLTASGTYAKNVISNWSTYHVDPVTPVDNPVVDPVDDPVNDPVNDPVVDPVDNPVDSPVDNPVDDPVVDQADPNVNNVFTIITELVDQVIQWVSKINWSKWF